MDGEKLTADECEIAKLVYLRARNSMAPGTAASVRRIFVGTIGSCDCGVEPEKLTAKRNAILRPELRRLWPQVKRSTDPDLKLL